MKNETFHRNRSDWNYSREHKKGEQVVSLFWSIHYHHSVVGSLTYLVSTELFFLHLCHFRLLLFHWLKNIDFISDFGWFFFCLLLHTARNVCAAPHRNAIKWKRCSHVWKKYFMPVDFDWMKWRNWFVLTPMLENLLIFQVTSENTNGMFLILFLLIVVRWASVQCTQ